ncbi:Protein of unknown function [Anaerobranca californiensis DSM 14826]|jgi:hypothetical protein|uniref:DUF2953 domain-containing protein n=1 Tax=Anaerobranca californiensis DSM 14826 TaxID=1120989 RepID=A0A1M6L1C6_9FIRM|nr:DUF2953 domain-containing protein [Anaerobranca californiensis]SHJ64963.1 Protein of unknown function [Anaerobranca californiensis DSM 14826]
MSLYWLLFLIPVILLIILLSPLQINIQGKKWGKDDRLDIGIHFLWGLIHFDLDIPKLIIRRNQLKVEGEVERDNRKPLIDKEKQFKFSISEFLSFLNYIIEKKNEILKLLSKVTKITKRGFKLTKFDLELEYGVEDAALTGILYGFIWQGISGLIFVLNKGVKFNCKPNVKIYPDFNRNLFKTELNCIFRTRVGYIIITSMFFLTMILKYKISTGLGGGKGVRTSNTRVNENGNGKY